MFDVKTIEKEAQEELAKEMGNQAKLKIKASLRTIAMAERALLNARQEHEILMLDIGTGEVAAA